MKIGEMAARLASHDWARTPLGPRESWPRSLSIAVGICMSSRFPMFVWWGPERVNIYNDAYIDVLGNKHPEAFGRPARDSWAEIWDVVGPQADAVTERGEATWNERVLLVMERKGYREETWFTWSYSPIFDESGGIGGLFCACYEDTKAVVAERERDRLLGEVTRERTRLLQAFAGSPSFLAVLEGPEHVFTFANERYLRLVGGRDVLGRRVADCLDEVREQGYVEILDTVYRTGEPFHGRGVRVMLRAGEGEPTHPVFVDFVYQPMHDASGKVNGILAAGMDVTHRHLAEARDRFLLALEDALRPLADPHDISGTAARMLAEHIEVDRCAYAEVSGDASAFEVVGNWNGPGARSIVGRYLMRDFGSERERCMREGRPYVVCDVERHQPPLDEVIASYRATGIRAMVAVPLHKAGRLVAVMGLHHGKPRQWIEHEIDLLTRVASRCFESIERGRAEHGLRLSEARFRQLADAMPQIVFAAGPDGHVDYFNRQWYEYTGLPEGEVGQESWGKVHTAEGLARVAAAWPEALGTGSSYEIEYQLRRHDGQYRWHLGRALPIRDAEGRIIRWYGTNTDIHDRKQIEEELGRALQNAQHARGEAELASRMKDEFLATLSHELRTPLNAILGWATMLRRPEAKPAQVAQGAEVIERNARAQSRIIEDLLDMSAIISGKVRLDVETVDLPAIARAAIETSRPTAEAKGVRLESDIAPLGGMQVRGDPHRLQQVFWNLLTNAIKFTPRDGQVRLSVREADERVEICVQDTGQGIAAEFLPYVFDRFRQADATTTRRHGGLGLGLSIVKQLVEMHGGAVRAKSDGPGKGATFIVSLPRLASEVPAALRADRRSGAKEEPPAAPHDESGLIRGLAVLVVDDDADARELVARLLEQCGAQVQAASSAHEALDRLGRGSYDVLVSDIGMPEEDGYSLIRNVRTQRPGNNGDIPAVALTAYARGEDRLKALRAGFQMHATKPVDPAELIAVVASLARMRRAPA